MIYISDTDPDQYFTASGHDGAHAAHAAELYYLIQRLTDKECAWDAVDPECYNTLSYLCDVPMEDDEGEYDPDAFMDACKTVIEKEKANG